MLAPFILIRRASQMGFPLCAAAAADPTLRVEVDLQAEVVRAPGVGEASFAVDAFARRCLLDGVDELGYLLAHAARIAEYEAQTARDSQDR